MTPDRSRNEPDSTTGHSLRYAVNLSILFTELPLLERPAAAAAAGFDAVEFWWPFASPTPSDSDADAFVTAIERAGVQLIGLNLFAGDMPAGDRGLVSWPGREQEFAAGVAAAAHIGERLGCPSFNALYGNRIRGHAPNAQDELAVHNLALAARTLADIGGTVLIEPISGIPAYPLRTAQDAVRVIDRVHASYGSTNLGLLADLYHLTVNGDDLPTAITTYASHITHVQIADAPGRHQPGTGTIDFPTHLNHIATTGYHGHVAAEYIPTGPTTESFDWLHTD